LMSAKVMIAAVFKTWTINMALPSLQLPPPRVR
jgi:hypothetical protein